ncbi:MAG TPA: hypothetical protein VIO36_15450 [Anaerolineaceae bacterium]
MQRSEAQIRRRALGIFIGASILLVLFACTAPNSNAPVAQASVLATQYYVPLVSPSRDTPRPPTATTPPTATSTKTATATKTNTPSRTPTTPATPIDFTNIVFLHHSVGDGLIYESDMRQFFQQKGYQFWDHAYNGQGMRAPKATSPYYTVTGWNYHIPYDSTDLHTTNHPKQDNIGIRPGGINALFSETLYTQGVPALPNACNISGVSDADKALTCLMRHQVIIIKSCYTNSDIDTDARIDEFKAVYRKIIAFADAHPDHIFITLGFAPQAQTDGFGPLPGSNTRSLQFISWLTSDPETSNQQHPNFYVIDMFNALANDSGWLDGQYDCRDNNCGDSHPNQTANMTVGNWIASEVDRVITDYETKYNNP